MCWYGNIEKNLVAYFIFVNAFSATLSSFSGPLGRSLGANDCRDLRLRADCRQAD